MALHPITIQDESQLLAFLISNQQRRIKLGFPWTLHLISPLPLWSLFPTEEQEMHDPHKEPTLFRAKWILPGTLTPLKQESI